MVTLNNKLHWRQAAERVELSLTTDRENYYEELCATAETAAWRNDQREIYSIINKISGKSRRNVVTSVRMRNGDIPSDAEESLNEWTEYFTELLNYTTTTSGGPPILRVSTDLDMSVEDFTKQEFTRALTECKFGKSPAIDTSMRAETMLFAGSDVQNCLLDVCNKVLNGHPPPWQWKTNIIILIQRKSTSQRMEYFRGMTLMSVTAKIYNRMLLNLSLIHI